jgi:phospholipid-transporting ATPase
LQYGYEFVARKPESVTIRVFNSRDEVYEVLNVIEFTSARKRMSVIVRTPKGEIKIYVKVMSTITVYDIHSFSACLIL